MSVDGRISKQVEPKLLRMKRISRTKQEAIYIASDVTRFFLHVLSIYIYWAGIAKRRSNTERPKPFSNLRSHCYSYILKSMWNALKWLPNKTRATLNRWQGGYILRPTPILISSFKMVISELARGGERLRERLSRDALPELAELTLPCERLAINPTCKRHTPSTAFLQGTTAQHPSMLQ